MIKKDFKNAFNFTVFVLIISQFIGYHDVIKLSGNYGPFGIATVIFLSIVFAQENNCPNILDKCLKYCKVIKKLVLNPKKSQKQFKLMVSKAKTTMSDPIKSINQVAEKYSFVKFYTRFKSIVEKYIR